jgi:hypothetical protein|tara:strand:- start:286 stop:543 length:258 start_codon:yes stop_codon:yes gene_type:complete
MPGRNKLLKQCESIARHSGLRCRAKGKLKKSGHYRCRFHGGDCEGATTLNGAIKAYKNLKYFKNFTDDEIRDYIKNKATKYYRED